MESNTLIPLPSDRDFLEADWIRPGGEGKCDFPGCGKVLTRRGMGRHKAIHARKAPPNPNDAIVEKLRERVKSEVADSLLAAEKCAMAIDEAFEGLSSTTDYDDVTATALRSAQMLSRNTIRAFNAAHDDLVILGVI